MKKQGKHFTHMHLAFIPLAFLAGCQSGPSQVANRDLECQNGIAVGLLIDDPQSGKLVLLRPVLQLRLSQYFSLTDEAGREFAFPISIPLDALSILIQTDGIVFVDCGDQGRMEVGQIVAWKLPNRIAEPGKEGQLQRRTERGFLCHGKQ